MVPVQERGEVERYARAWREYRLRRNVALTLTLSLPVIWLVWPASLQGAALFFAWGALSGISGAYALLWLCPRCRNTFAMFSLWREPWTQRCLHCGLPKWSTRSDAGSE